MHCNEPGEKAYALSDKSTPPEIRTEVEERAAKGEKVTAAEIEVGNCDDNGEIISGSDWRKGVASGWQ